MANALSRGGFVVCVELVPPRGYRADALIEQARQLKIRGVDLVNIPDGPMASARMSALSAAVLVQQQAGVEPILHYACRDRNLLAMQSDLFGAHAMGVRNLLVITGDPPQVGDYPDATAVGRCGLDRPDQRRCPAQSRLRHRRPAHRPTDGLPHRRGRQPGGAEPGGRAAPLRVQGRGRGRVRSDPAGVRCRGAESLSRARLRRTRSRSSPASCRSRARGTPNSWRTKCRVYEFPTPCSSGCGVRMPPDGRRRKGWRSPARSPLRFARSSAAYRFRQRRARSIWPWASSTLSRPSTHAPAVCAVSAIVGLRGHCGPFSCRSVADRAIVQCPTDGASGLLYMIRRTSRADRTS